VRPTPTCFSRTAALWCVLVRAWWVSRRCLQRATQHAAYSAHTRRCTHPHLPTHAQHPRARPAGVRCASACLGAVEGGAREDALLGRDLGGRDLARVAPARRQRRDAHRVVDHRLEGSRGTLVHRVHSRFLCRPAVRRDDRRSAPACVSTDAVSCNKSRALAHVQRLLWWWWRTVAWRRTTSAADAACLCKRP
jgi:hypothetical protein